MNTTGTTNGPIIAVTSLESYYLLAFLPTTFSYQGMLCITIWMHLTVSMNVVSRCFGNTYTLAALQQHIKTSQVTFLLRRYSDCARSCKNTPYEFLIENIGTNHLKNIIVITSEETESRPSITK